MVGQSSRTVPASVADKLYAAADVIAANGLANTKVEDIALASGVPKATLYYHFAGKDEILSFLLMHSLAALAGEVADAAHSPGQGRDQLAAVIAVHIEHTMHRAGTSRALVGDLGRAVRLPELASAVQKAFYEPIAQVLETGATDGSLRAVDDPQSTAISIFGAVMMTAMVHNVMATDKTVGDIADGVIALIMNGLTPP
jgi:AcrR family transcriptional regulator